MEDSAHPFHQLRERMPESVEFFVVGKGHRGGITSSEAHHKTDTGLM